MTIYDFLWVERVILSNVRTESYLTWFQFGQLVMWIGHMSLFRNPIGPKSHWSEIPWNEKNEMKELNRFWWKSWYKFSIGPPFHRFPKNIGYGNVRTDSQLDLISLLVKLSCTLGQIMTIYDFLWVERLILSNVRTESYLTWFQFGQLVLWIGHMSLFRNPIGPKSHWSEIPWNEKNEMKELSRFWWKSWYKFSIGPPFHRFPKNIGLFNFRFFFILHVTHTKPHLRPHTMRVSLGKYALVYDKTFKARRLEWVFNEIMAFQENITILG